MVYMSCHQLRAEVKKLQIQLQTMTELHQSAVEHIEHLDKRIASMTSTATVIIELNDEPNYNITGGFIDDYVSNS